MQGLSGLASKDGLSVEFPFWAHLRRGRRVVLDKELLIVECDKGLGGPLKLNHAKYRRSVTGHARTAYCTT